MLLFMRLFMTVMWCSVAIGPIAADFNDTHLFNPDWPPHARLHMMTVFTSAVALATYGLYQCWGPSIARLEQLRDSAILGFLYCTGLLIATVTMPRYGGSLYWLDTEPRAATMADENLVVFVWTTIVFAGTFVVLQILASRAPKPDAGVMDR